MMGDINALSKTSIDIDTSDLEQSITKKIDSIYQNRTIKIKKTTVGDQKLVLTPNGEICMYSEIIVDIVDSNTEIQTATYILTALETKN